VARSGTVADLFLPPHGEPRLIPDGRRPVSLRDVQFDARSGHVQFDAAGERWNGTVSGGFHGILSLPFARIALVEVLGALVLLVACALLRPAWVRGAALVLTAAPLVALAAGRDRPMPAFDFAPPPAVQWLLAHAGETRVAPIGHDVFVPNTNAVYGVRSVALSDPVQACRYLKLIGAANRPDAPPACGGEHESTLTVLSADALNLVAAQYAIVSAADEPGTGATDGSAGDPLALAYEDAAVRIYRHTAAAPPAYVAGDVELVPWDAPDVLGRVISSAGGLARHAIVETDRPPNWSPTNLPATWSAGPPCAAGSELVRHAAAGPSAEAAVSHAVVVHESLDALRLRVNAPAGGFLVLTDAYDPGWRAYVDGDRAPLCRANYLFRAVPLLPGSHDVQFVYRPLSFTIALILAGLSLAACAALLARPHVRRASAGGTAAGWLLLLSFVVTVWLFSPLRF